MRNVARETSRGFTRPVPVGRIFSDASTDATVAGSLVDLSDSPTAQTHHRDQTNLALTVGFIAEPGIVSPVMLAGLVLAGGVELNRNG